MKYMLRGENNYNNPIETVLKNRNITLDLFNVGEEVVEDYDNYDHMEEGVTLLLSHIKKGNLITIIQDCDVDGLTSFASIFRYIRDVLKYSNISYKIHSGKQHGLSDDIKIENNVGLVILPDSLSNDYNQYEELKNRKIDVLILDHHLAKKYSDSAIVINNQLSKNIKNKNLAGAGVTYKFLQALDDYCFNSEADNYIDLMCLGNVADVISHKEPETRYYGYLGLKNINNPFIKALIEISSFELEGKYNFDKIGWTIAPKLNGCIRSGSYEEKEKMLQGFLSDDYDFCLEVAEMCKKVKQRQDNAVKTALKKIVSDINITKEDKCLIIEVSNRLKSNYTGLVAGKLASKYGVPVLLYRDIKGEDGIVGGSGRGCDNITNNFNQDLKNSGLFVYCEGHNNAFGHSFKKENLDDIKQYLNNLYKNKKVINGKTHKIDFILDENVEILKIVKELSQYEDEWGNGIDVPLLLFKDVTICIENDNIKGSRSKNMIFNYNGVKFIKKYLSNDLKEQVLNQGILFVDIIGKCVLSHYMGKDYPQVEIVDISIM